MKTHFRKQFAGFTLLELLVVLAIIAIFSYYIVIQGTGRRPFQELQHFTEQLQSLVQAAHEQSESSMIMLGLRIDKRQYEFYQHNESTAGGWSALSLRDSFWKRYPVPSSLQLHLSLLGGPPGKNEPGPQIIFYPDGDYSAFIITVSNKGTRRRLQIVGNPPGPVLIREIP